MHLLKQERTMSRAELLAGLEGYWYGVRAANPDEALDIGEAMYYYKILSTEQLVREYNEKIG
jgi:hypothetical protein